MRIYKTLGLVLNVLLLFATSVPADDAKTEKLYYAIDQNGTVCGFAEVHISPDVWEGKDVIAIDDSLEMSISALGASVKGIYRFTYKINPVRGSYYYHTSDINQGTLQLGGVVTIAGDTAHIVSKPGDEVEHVALPENVLLENTRIQ